MIPSTFMGMVSSLSGMRMLFIDVKYRVDAETGRAVAIQTIAARMMLTSNFRFFMAMPSPSNDNYYSLISIIALFVELRNCIKLNAERFQRLVCADGTCVGGEIYAVIIEVVVIIAFLGYREID